MSTETPNVETKPVDRTEEAEQQEVSFAETALKLGGKSEEEARRTGAVDAADEQVEKLFKPKYQTANSPAHRAVWDRKVPVDLFDFTTAAPDENVAKVMEDSLTAVVTDKSGTVRFGPVAVNLPGNVVPLGQDAEGFCEYSTDASIELQLNGVFQRQFGLDLHLLTGDNPQRAAQVAAELGIPADRVYSEAFPDQKAKIVRDLHRAGRTVAFVGDGLNDSVALAYADVSISFERGADIARETADVVLMNNNLLELLEAIAIARETRDLIEQNIALVVLPNLLALGLASTAGLNPLIATAIHNGSAIAAGLNSLRPLVTHEFVPNAVIE